MEIAEEECAAYLVNDDVANEDAKLVIGDLYDCPRIVLWRS
jgi:hypothetical protein